MLNIKDPEAHRLAKEIVAETGESLTQAVIVALRDRHARVVPPPVREFDRAAIDAIVKETSAAFRNGPKFEIEDLYDDETGLPK